MGKQLAFVKNAKILCVDTRLSNQKVIEHHKVLEKQLDDLGVKMEKFVAGKGIGPYKYDMIDTNDLPPNYSHSCRNVSWMNRPNAYNAFKCHQMMMNDALSREENILLLEDDIVITSDAAEILDKAGAPPDNWDILYLGSTYHQGIDVCSSEFVENPRWIRSTYNFGYYATILNVEVMKDLAFSPPFGPMDWITCGRLPNLNSYCLAAPIVLQQPNPSIVEAGNVDSQVQHQWNLSKNRL